MESKKLEFACCFCFESGAVEGDEPIEVAVAGQRDEREHVFYAHLDCLRRALHPQIDLQVPFYRDDGQDEDSPEPPSDPDEREDDEGSAASHEESAGLRLVQSSGPVRGRSAE